MNTIEELLERKRSSSGLEIQEYGRRDPSIRPRGTLYPQRLALTSPSNGSRLFILCWPIILLAYQNLCLQGLYLGEVYFLDKNVSISVSTCDISI
jgi:hypothetical protein